MNFDMIFTSITAVMLPKTKSLNFSLEMDWKVEEFANKMG